MKAMFNVVFLLILGICYNAQLRKNCEPEGADCDWAMGCCAKLHCIDNRCVPTKGKDVLKYWPKGPKCNWLNHCNDIGDGKTYECVSHRCVEQLPQLPPEEINRLNSQINK